MHFLLLSSLHHASAPSTFNPLVTHTPMDTLEFGLQLQHFLVTHSHSAGLATLH